jgi:hypothetical protein
LHSLLKTLPRLRYRDKPGKGHFATLGSLAPRKGSKLFGCSDAGNPSLLDGRQRSSNARPIAHSEDPWHSRLHHRVANWNPPSLLSNVIVAAASEYCQFRVRHKTKSDNH